MALQENLRNYQQQVVQKALTSMQQLTQLASQLGKKEATTNFQGLIEKLRSDKFNLAVVGRFKNGKSTFANALLGPPTSGRILNGDKGPMPTSRVPCTAVLTYVRHGERPSVKALHMDGKTDENWTFDKYLEKGKVQIEDDNNKVFENIKAFVVDYPSPLLKEGLVLVDTPGTDDVPERTRIARDAIKRADAAIVVYSSNHPAGEAEIAFVNNQLVGTVAKIYTVINMFFEPDEEFRRVVWNRLVPEPFRKPYNPDKFQEHGIYFINALDAFKGKQSGNILLQQQSGLLAFEQAVATFLTRERGKTHLLSSVFPAANSSKQLAEEIDRQITLLKADEEKFRQAIDKLTPRLAELKRRPQEIRRLFEYHETRLKDRLRVEFDLQLSRLTKDIPDYMATVDLPSLQGYTDIIFKQQKCVDEARQTVETYIATKIRNWNEEEATPIVERTMETLSTELEEIFGRIKADTRFIEIHLNSTLTAGENVVLVNQWDKIMGVAYGLIVQDYVHLATGGAFGWRGLATAFATRMVIYLGAIFAGATAGIAIAAAVIGGAVASFFFGREAAGRSLRKRMAASFVEAITNDRPQMLTDLEENITEKFSEFSGPVLKLVQNQIDQDIEGIEQMARDNERGQAEKLTLIRTLEKAKADVLTHHKVLSEIHLNL